MNNKAQLLGVSKKSHPRWQHTTAPTQATAPNQLTSQWRCETKPHQNRTPEAGNDPMHLAVAFILSVLFLGNNSCDFFPLGPSWGDVQNCMDGAHCAHMSTKVGYSSMTVLPAILARSLVSNGSSVEGSTFHLTLFDRKWTDQNACGRWCCNWSGDVHHVAFLVQHGMHRFSRLMQHFPTQLATVAHDQVHLQWALAKR